MGSDSVLIYPGNSSFCLQRENWEKKERFKYINYFSALYYKHSEDIEMSHSLWTSNFALATMSSEYMQVGGSLIFPLSGYTCSVLLASSAHHSESGPWPASAVTMSSLPRTHPLLVVADPFGSWNKVCNAW